jgi:uncharacterized protein (DUF362 family)
VIVLPASIFYSRSGDRTAFVEKVLATYRHKVTGKVLIKVNLVSNEPYPTTTHPDILEAVLTTLKGMDLVVGDAPAVDFKDFQIQESPLYKICEKHAIPFINFYQTEMQLFKSPRRYEFNATSYPLHCNYIISLPILKCHMDVHLSGALKNAFGYLAKRDRILMHINKKNIHQGIAELNGFFKPNLTIMDGIETLIKAQEVRHGGIKENLGYLLAGEDPLALDIFGFSLLKKIYPSWKVKAPQDILYLKHTMNLGIGVWDYKAQEI